MAEKIKPRRRKTEADRINLEDWSNAGALDGLLSFLNIAPEQAPVNQGTGKVLHLLEDRHPPKETPSDIESLPEQIPALIQGGDLQAGVPDLEPPSIPVMPAAMDIRTGSETEPLSVIRQVAWTHPKQATGFGNKKLYRCVSAQDGHSHTEEALYQILWQAGRPETDDTRLTIMGYGEMSKRVRLSFNNTKYACQRLIAKMAIEEVAREVSDLGQGKTYRVFSHAAILSRRRANGMEWVIRNKGVEFVTPLPIPVQLVTDALPVPEPSPKRGGSTETGPAFFHPWTSIKDRPSEQEFLFSVLAEYGQPAPDAGELLLTRCRNVVPDCTAVEIAHFVRQKGALLRENRAFLIPDPIGFLLTTVPKVIASEAFSQFREAERQRDAEIEQWRREQAAILEDPSAPEEDKLLARRVLGLIENG